MKQLLCPSLLILIVLPFLLVERAPAQFVEASGNDLVLNGETVYLKGSNYYPKDHYWQRMWPDWDPPQIQAELDLLQGMGGNTLRILVPFDHGWTDADGYVNGTYLNRLDQLVGWCNARGMRPIITLFDWRTEWPAAGTFEDTREIRYLTTIVNRFRDDPRVLLWDVKNEPDNPLYGGWDDVPSNHPKIDWLERRANQVRDLDPHHPIGVGMTSYTNNYYGLNGKSVHSFVDVILFHNYNAPDTQRQINDQKNWNNQSGARPILMEEGGWPTNSSYNPDYTEAKQLEYYQTVMPVIAASGISGFVQWALVDATNTGSADDSYGLLRSDYSRKPAADVFQNGYTVQPFPVVPEPPLELRIDLGPTNLPDGLDYVNVAFDGETEALADVARRTCRRTRSGTGDNFLYLACDDALIYDTSPEIFIEVDYLDGVGGQWLIEYDGLNNAYQATAAVSVGSGTPAWKTHRFHLTDTRLANRQNGGADFRLNGLGFADGVDDTFAEVRVYTEEPGNTDVGMWRLY